MTKAEQSATVINTLMPECVACKKRKPSDTVGMLTHWCSECAAADINGYWAASVAAGAVDVLS